MNKAQGFLLARIKRFFGFGRDVFISYHVEEGKAYASALQQHLCNSKVSVFFDNQEMCAGDILPKSLGAGVADSTAFIIVGSRNVWNRPWVRKETEIYFHTHSNPRVIRIAFDDSMVPSDFPGAEKIKDSVSLRENLESLKCGLVSNTISDGINRSLNFTRARSRRRRGAFLITSCVLTMICYTTFSYFRGQDPRIWVPTDGRAEIRYSYDDPQLRFVVGLPTKAEAYWDGKLIATAVLQGLDIQDQRVVGIKVEETHVSSSGSVIYTGKIRFEIQHAILTMRAAEVPIRGKKKYDIFVSWPMGGGGP